MVIVNEHPCLVLNFRGNGFSISSLAMTLPVALSYIVFFNYWLSFIIGDLSVIFCFSYWFNFEKLYFSRNLPIFSSGLSILLAHIYSCFSVSKLCLAPHDHMDHSISSLPVPHHLMEFTQVHVHCISDDIQPSHPLSPSFPSTFNLSQHQAHFQWVSSSYHMSRVVEIQLQHQSLQWIFRVDFL